MITLDALNVARRRWRLAMSVLILSISANATAARAQQAVASVVHEDTFDCFTPGLAKENGELVTCEVSATVHFDGRVVFGSDKPVVPFGITGKENEILRVGGYSSVFRMDVEAYADPVRSRRGYRVLPWSQRYFVNSAFLTATKYEAMTLIADQREPIMMASTGFDRIDPDSAALDSYNTLLSWPAGQTKPVTVIERSERNGVASSRALREKFSRALASGAFPNGPPYFKIEGLAALPDERLLFGVREVGRGFRAGEFEYVIKIIAVSFTVEDGVPILGDDFTSIYDFPPPRIAPGGHPVALSSVEYDIANRRLYLLTSFEISDGENEPTDEDVGGFLWTLTLADLDAGRPPTRVNKPDGTPLMFAHKPEGLAILDDAHILVVHDDDRVRGRPQVDNPAVQFAERFPHQASYTVLRFD